MNQNNKAWFFTKAMQKCVLEKFVVIVVCTGVLFYSGDKYNKYEKRK